MVGLGFGHTFAGDYEKGAHWYGRAVEAMPGSPAVVMFLGWTHGIAGRREEAEAILGQLAAHSHAHYGAWVEFALGDFDAGFQSLEHLLEQRHPTGLYFVMWPGQAAVRADPRYAEVMERVGLGHLLQQAPGPGALREVADRRRLRSRELGPDPIPVSRLRGACARNVRR